MYQGRGFEVIFPNGSRRQLPACPGSGLNRMVRHRVRLCCQMVLSTAFQHAAIAMGRGRICDRTTTQAQDAEQGGCNGRFEQAVCHAELA
jgi:hypothetical protein